MQSLQSTLLSMGLIDVDASLFIQLALFLLLMVVLRALVFKPYLEADEERAKKTEKTRQDARVLEARATELSSRYESEFGAARTKAASARAALRGEGMAQRDQAVSAASAEAAKQLDEVRTSIEGQLAEARKTMMGQVDNLGKQVAEKIIGRGL